MKNIVLILTDDQRWDTVDAMPKTLGIFSGGTRFLNAFATTPECAPARACILTGQYARHHGVKSNAHGHRLQTAHSLAPWLQAAGYETWYGGKYLNRYDTLSVPPGWDAWKVFKGTPSYYDYDINNNGTSQSYDGLTSHYSTDLLCKKAVAFIEHAAAPPWCLVYAPKAPHSVGNGPAIPAPRHQGDSVTLPAKPLSYNVVDVSHPDWVHTTNAWTGAKQGKYDLNARHSLRALKAVDDAVENIFNAVGEAGQLAEPLFIYPSDGGFLLGEHRLKGKLYPYEESIRTPLLIRCGGAPPSATSAGIALGIDLLPTVLDFADASISSSVDGLSLRPVLEGTAPAVRSDCLVECWESKKGLRPYVGVRGQDYLYTEYDTSEREYYDLATDPYQLVNVFGQPAYAAAVTAAQGRLAALGA